MHMVEHAPLSAVAVFLERYKRFTTEKTDLRLQAFQAGFAQLAIGLQTLEKLGRALERQQAHRFNLFQLLGIARNERRTHSAFLRELLDPEGCHGRGISFSKHFSSILGGRPGLMSFQGLLRN
jgi:hypothetical protein